VSRFKTRGILAPPCSLAPPFAVGAFAYLLQVLLAVRRLFFFFCFSFVLGDRIADAWCAQGAACDASVEKYRQTRVNGGLRRLFSERTVKELVKPLSGPPGRSAGGGGGGGVGGVAASSQQLVPSEKKILVLDLDETLIHSTMGNPGRPGDLQV
jgi:hypothetical protein